MLHVLDATTSDSSTKAAAATNTATTTTTTTTDDGIPLYWQRVHLMLTFRILVSRTSSELASAVLGSHKTDTRDIEQLPYAQVTPAQLSERLRLFQDLLAQLQDTLETSEAEVEFDVENNDNEGKSTGGDGAAQILAKVARAYKLNTFEKRVLQFLVTTKIQPCTCALFLVLPSTADYYTCLPGSGHGGDENMAFLSSTIRYVTAGTAMEWKDLANDDHPLCQDRVLIWEHEEYTDTSKLCTSTEACKALLNLKMTSEDKLKLAGTRLLELVVDNGDVASSHNNVDLAPMVKLDQQQPLQAPKDGDSDGSVGDILSKLQISSDRNPVEEMMVEDDVGSENDDGLLVELMESNGQGADNKDEGEIDDDMKRGEEKVDDNEEEDRTKPRAFENELDYLRQCFEIAMHKVTFSRQRVAQDLRNASLNDSKPSWKRDAADNSAKQRSVGEISAKLRLESRKMEMSLALTRQEGKFYPRLELLAEQLELDDFQKFVLVYLAGSMISPIFKSCIQLEDSYNYKHVTVGDLLVAYFDTFSEQVAARTYFYKSSQLMRKGIIKPIYGYTPPPDLTDQELRLDRRVLETIVGLDKESSEISQGSHLYEPKVSLDAVVLPEKLKETITASVNHFETFKTYRKHHPDFSEAISYGVGLTLMFCGKSGKNDSKQATR